MENWKRVVLAGLVAATLVPQGVAWSADLARQGRGATAASAQENGGFLELGVVVVAERSAFARKDPAENGDGELGLELSLSGGYQYERLFIEATESWFGGLNLGVNLAHTDNWSVDLLLANIAGIISIDSDEPPPPATENERNNAILDRDSLFIAAGTRVTGYFDDNIVQLRLVSDWYEGNGIQGSLRAGRQWQLGNWNLQGLIGARYYSAQFNSYLYGVTATEASTRFPAYSADNAWIPELELGASYPINKDWIYTSRLRYKQLPGSITDSPIVAEDDEVVVQTGFHYVF